MEGLIKIKSVKEVPGFVPPYSDANRYNGSKSVINRKYLYKALHIKGTMNCKEVSFFSPTVEFTRTTGMLNHTICHNKNGWFDVLDGAQTAHYGAKMFDNGITPNVALDSHSKIIILINIGDEIKINYSVKNEEKGYLTRVKIIK